VLWLLGGNQFTIYVVMIIYFELDVPSWMESNSHVIGGRVGWRQEDTGGGSSFFTS
jgi:hypothetical protein